MLEKDIKKILISQDEITAAAKKLGAQLTKDYDRTNDFYRGLGFKKLEIFSQLWNP